MYLPILDLRMVTLVTDAEDKLVAVGISMPSLSEALQKSHGRLLPFGWYHLLKALFMKRRAKMLDLLLVAVKPEYQNKGVNALLFSDLIPVYQKLGFVFAKATLNWNKTARYRHNGNISRPNSISVEEHLPRQSKNT